MDIERERLEIGGRVNGSGDVGQPEIRLPNVDNLAIGKQAGDDVGRRLLGGSIDEHVPVRGVNVKDFHCGWVSLNWLLARHQPAGL
jgi:hypothetical protein